MVNVTVLAAQLLLERGEVHFQAVREAATKCPRPCKLTISSYLFARWRAVPACWLFKTSAASWPFDAESGVRVTCDVGYFYANLGLPRHLCSRRLRPDVRADDVRQTSDKHHRL